MGHSGQGIAAADRFPDSVKLLGLREEAGIHALAYLRAILEEQRRVAPLLERIAVAVEGLREDAAAARQGGKRGKGGP